MAKQGNYVTVPGMDSNWAKGTSSALADLSKVLTAQSETEKKLALVEARDREDKRRYEEDQERKDAEAKAAANRFESDYELRSAREGRDQRAFEDKQNQRDWLGQAVQKYDPRTLRLRKMEALRVSPESIPENIREDVINATPLYQEDVKQFIGSDFTSQFGVALPEESISHVLNGVPSLSSLQEKADKEVEAKQTRLDKQADYQLKVAQHNTSEYGTGKSKPKSVAEIDIIELSKPYQGNAFYNLFTSEKVEASTIASISIDGLISKYPKVKKYPEAVSVGVNYMLGRLTEGGENDRIDYDEDKAAALLAEGVTLHLESMGNSKSGGGYGGTGTSTKLPPRLETVDPINVRMKNLREWKAMFDPTAAEQPKTKSAGSEQPRAELGEGRPLTGNILENLNIFVEGRDTATAPDESTAAFTRELLPLPESADLDIDKDSTDLERSRAYQYTQDQEIVTGLRDTMGSDPLVGDNPLGAAVRLVAGEGILEGKDGTPLDTLLVYPFDKSGNEKSWKDVVADINNRPSIDLWDRISPDEAREAEGDPAKQREIIDAANYLIANDVKGGTGISRAASEGRDLTVRAFAPIANTVSGVYEAVYGGLFGGYEYNPEQDAKDRARYEQERKDAELRKEVLGEADAFVNRRVGLEGSGGGVGQFVESTGDAIEASPTMQATVAAASLIPAIKAGKGLYNVGKKALAGRKVPVGNVPSRGKVDLDNIFGPPIDKYWKNMDIPPVQRKGLDEIAYQRWLRNNANR